MTEHFIDDVLVRIVQTGPNDPRHRRHLSNCPDCRTRMAVWQNTGSAMRAEAAEQTVSPPSFDALLGPALTGADPRGARERLFAAPLTVPARAVPGHTLALGHRWRTAWQLALRQAVVMPKIWAPLSVVGFVGAALLASAQVQDRFGLRLFSAVAVLLVMFGALMAASPRRDPRRELLFTLPVPPTAVFLARLTVVLSADVALAMACSTLVDGPGWWAVVSSWLGKSLMAASLALALSVRIAPAVGSAVGGAIWLLGVVTGPQGVFTTPIDALLNTLLSTTPWTFVLTIVLLGWATSAMRSFGEAVPA